MRSELLVALMVVALAVIAFVWFKRKRQEDGSGFVPTFYGRKPVTETEQVLFNRLVDALPECVVLAQVQLSQIVGIKKGKGWQSWFNKISRKSVDFLVCLKDFTIVAAIELDDSTHNREDRKTKDADKDTALTGAGINVIRWKVKDMPSVKEIRSILHK